MGSLSWLAELQKLFPTGQLSAAAADRQQHAQDQSAYTPCLPDVVVWAESVADVQAVLRFANQHRVAVTAWGAGTSIEGNPIPVQGGIVLNLLRMNRILAVHGADFQVTVQPGVLYKDMNHFLANEGLFFAPDPGANATIGGMLANNAAGIRTVKYGATRDNVLALQVVLADGEVIRTGSRSVKQSAGYDLTHLFVGSEGTLGVITEATLKLHPVPALFSAAKVAFPSVETAAAAVFEIMGCGLEPSALELLDQTAVAIIRSQMGIDLLDSPYLFMEFSSSSQIALQEAVAMAAGICQTHHCLSYQSGVGQEERNRLWQARHHAFEAHLRHFPGQSYLVTDFAVPISQYSALVIFASATMSNMGLQGSILSHAGDGNAHVVIFYPADDQITQAKAILFNEQLVYRALELGGTCTGEHGVGLGKQKFMLREHGAGALNLMRQIKLLLDPQGILNPGKVLGLGSEKEN